MANVSQRGTAVNPSKTHQKNLPILTPPGDIEPLSPYIGVLFRVIWHDSQTFSKFLPVQIENKDSNLLIKKASTSG